MALILPPCAQMKGRPTKHLCPISKLPAELLVEIFLDVVSPSVQEASSPPTLCAPHTPSYLSCASPFSLSHVCSTWRTVSLSLSSLWTSLQVVYPNDPKILPLLSLWVQRSRSHKLNLSLHQLHGYRRAVEDDARNFELEFEATRRVWQLFLTLIDRWLHLDVDVCMSFRSLLDNVDGTFLQRGQSVSLPLEAIKVHFGPCESTLYGKGGEAGTVLKNFHPIFSDESAFFLHVLRCSPRLHTVEWDNRYVPIPFDLVTKWPTSLTDITFYRSQDFVSILPSLSMCKSLQSLTVYEQTMFSPHLGHLSGHFFNIPGGTSRKLPPLVFPCLETIKLGSFPHPELLFDRLVAPSLHTLIVLRGYNGRRGWRGLTRTAWFALSEMLARSHLTNMSTLQIGGVVLDMGEFDGLHCHF